MADFQYYKDYPLVRTGKNKIYYGNMSDECVCEINIVSTKEENGLEIADEIVMYIMRTAEDLDALQAIVRKISPKSLYEALETANSLLNKFNKQNA
jgi:hypothetical protein